MPPLKKACPPVGRGGGQEVIYMGPYIVPKIEKISKIRKKYAPTIILFKPTLFKQSRIQL